MTDRKAINSFHEALIADIRLTCPWFDQLVEHLTYVGRRGGQA